MKKTFKILCLALTLAVSVSLLAGCGTPVEKEQAKSLPKVPEAIEDMRDDAMELTQKFVQDNEGQFAERIANLVTLNPSSIDESNYEYTAIADSLKEFTDSTDAEEVFIFVKNEDGTFHKTVSTEKKSEWLEEITFTEATQDCLDGALITSAKSGYDGKWPIYAPMYNTAGEVAAYACVEYKFDELSDYPEWDRNNEKWHGIE